MRVVSTAIVALVTASVASAFVAPGRPAVPASILQSSITEPSKDIWDASSPIIVQGGALRTWSTPTAERVLVLLRSEGRPLNANVELWHGPDNTPQKMKVYIEDGSKRPFCGVIESPRGQNAVAIRNTGQLEFPLTAAVVDDLEDASPGLSALTRRDAASMVIVQGGAVRTYPFDTRVASVAVLLRTDGRPLNARIELLQGPNNNKQVLEVYTEDGMERPFFVVLETPGSGNVVRIVNTATVEFPMSASVEPYVVDSQDNNSAAQGWDNGGPGTRQLGTGSSGSFMDTRSTSFLDTDGSAGRL